MQFILRIAAIVAMTSMVLMADAHAETLTLVAEDDWYPYTADQKGQAEGWGVEVIRAAYSYCVKCHDCRRRNRGIDETCRQWLGQ